MTKVSLRACTCAEDACAMTTLGTRASNGLLVVRVASAFMYRRKACATKSGEARSSGRVFAGVVVGVVDVRSICRSRVPSTVKKSLSMPLECLSACTFFSFPRHRDFDLLSQDGLVLGIMQIFAVPSPSTTAQSSAF